MLPAFHPPPGSRYLMTTGCWLLTSLGREHHLSILWQPLNHTNIPASVWGAGRRVPSAQACGSRGEKWILLAFLLCRVLVGTGFSSLQLAKASSTKLEVWLWERQKLKNASKLLGRRFSQLKESLMCLPS